MGRRTRHHLVSQGHQRAWADETGRIWYVDKKSNSAKLVGTKDAFVARDFLTMDRGDGPTDELETEFAEIEGRSLSGMRE